MKEQIITREVKEVNGYIADDGTWFKQKEDCIQYEESAKMVLFQMVKDKMIGKTTELGLFDVGYEDNDVEIYRVDSLQTLELLNRYTYVTSYDKTTLFTSDMIGKDVIICWNYDRDACWCKGTIDDIINDIKNTYNRILQK